MNYDPQLRHDTPLALKLKAQISKIGPMLVAEYMSACLHDPEHGYYLRQPAIGARGDFVTAPEISQVFGELIGLWCAVVWQQMGSPDRINLVELGPGRGTLMRDALRAARLVPGFFNALSVHLVECNVGLAHQQARTLADCGVPVRHHDCAHTVIWDDTARAGAPSIVIGNEFLDTFGVHQLAYVDDGWRSRVVTLDDDNKLQFGSSEPLFQRPMAIPNPREPEPGDIFEVSISRHVFARINFTECAKSLPFAALMLDYGHTQSGFGDTLQAVRNHAYEHPLTAPGEADLTAQVDFEAFATACRSLEDEPLAIDGPVTQAEFLGGLGIVERASRLMSANPARAAEIEAGVARLIAPSAMGTRFKAIGVRSRGLPPLPGFGS